MKIKIAPSILSADFSKLEEEVKAVEAAGADLLHLDIMDGHFVPNITFGPVVVKALKGTTKLPLEAHLMISNPLEFIEPFAKAGADIINFHIESVDLETAKSVIEAIKKAHKVPAVTVNPITHIDAIKPLLNDVEMVMIMSVNPGFAGQFFIDVTEKIKKLRSIYKGDIQVDGGINAETGKLVREAGANVLAAASYIFKSKDYGKAISNLRG